MSRRICRSKITASGLPVGCASGHFYWSLVAHEIRQSSVDSIALAHSCSIFVVDFPADFRACHCFQLSIGENQMLLAEFAMETRS